MRHSAAPLKKLGSSSNAGLIAALTLAVLLAFIAVPAALYALATQ